MSKKEGAFRKTELKRTEKTGYDLTELRKCMEKELDPKRYEHTLGVAYTAAALAMRYGADIKKVQTAGLLHDCAKNLTNEKLIRTCHKHNIAINAAEQKNPSLLHAKVGSFLAWHKYGIEDREILDAIMWHTTGKPEMRLLDKILYIADYIEPGRNQAPNLPQARKLAFVDLDGCLFLILRDTLAYLSASKTEIDPMTQQTYDYYRNEKEKGGCQ
ncbi:MAG TPA: bis(5'-nucleosyl)-tetraphosphatase (symmetrical) YqeK [Candidatus Eisenbergiella merdipullorum]|uniref:bis(5'-nucleosyl)-tetraphosphatase (symmetrical) n=1 Tax=Candidatus Eisenbergiella merdipullorum TaxID=2838553 RepID=A0A9D2L1Y8_9FIRM|nr:bis(5'-nucleosyl)-tetraphosphatase (symmetrical) YqeK [Candidatus Eisenbergiella merdipullorum]